MCEELRAKQFNRLWHVALLRQNWDSYGAEGVRELSVYFAHRFLHFMGDFAGIDQPQITATPSGLVAFSWQVNSGSIDIEFDETGQVICEFETCDGDFECQKIRDLAYVCNWVHKKNTA